MAVLVAMPEGAAGEAVYGGATKVTGASSAQAWDASAVFAERSGGVEVTFANTTHFEKTYSGITSAFHSTRYYVNPVGISLPNNTNLCYLSNLFSPLSGNAANYTGLYNDAGTIKLYSRLRNDALGLLDTLAVIPGGYAGIEWIEERLYKSSGSGVNDGKKEVYVNGDLVASNLNAVIWNIFNYTTSRFGATISGASGVVEIGQIVVTDEAGPIGPLDDESGVFRGGGGGSIDSLSSYVHIG